MGELWEIVRVLAWSFLERRAMDKELNPVLGQAAMECLHVLEAREWAGKWDPKLKVRLRREKILFSVTTLTCSILRVKSHMTGAYKFRAGIE